MLNKVYDLIKQKIKLMEEIYKITAEQSQFLVPEKSGGLLDAIDRKQEHIDNINEINDELRPLEKRILNCCENPGGEEANKIFEEKLEGFRILKEKANLIAAKISALEKQNLQRISGEFQGLKRDIELLNIRKGTLKAYGGKPFQSDGYFVDNKK